MACKGQGGEGAGSVCRWRGRGKAWLGEVLKEQVSFWQQGQCSHVEGEAGGPSPDQ